MTIKWNGRLVDGVDARPHLEKLLITYHMYIDKEVSHHALIREVGRIWDMLEDKAST